MIESVHMEKNDIMTTNGHALQLWSLPVHSVHTQQTLTFAILEDFTAIPNQAFGSSIAPIRNEDMFHVNDIDDLPNTKITRSDGKVRANLKVMSDEAWDN
jgi:hypothetical protein